MQRVIHSLADLVNPGVRGQAVTLDENGAAAWRDAEVVNVREYDILGDGTNEYTKLQGLVTAIGAGTQKRKRLIFPEPTGTKYVIATPVDVDQVGINIKGARRGVILEQSTANEPVFRWTGDLSAGLNNVRIEDLTIQHAALADASTTKQYGIMFRPDAATTGTSANGAYLMAFVNCWFTNCYVGIGQDTSGSGTFPIWSTLFRDLVFRDTQLNAIKLQSAGNQGQPNIVIDHIDVLNYDSSNVNTGSAIIAKAVSGLTMMGLNIEDWQDRILDIQGGTYTVLDGLRTERHDLMTSAVNVLYLANGKFVLSGIDLSGLRIQHGTSDANTVNLVKADAGAHVIVNGLQASKAGSGYTPTAGKVSMLSGSPSTGSWIYADGVSDDSANNILAFQPNTVSAGLFGVRRYNGRPPAWNTTPTAADTYRGMQCRIEGGAGVADQLLTCEKDGADSYSWRAI